MPGRYCAVIPAFEASKTIGALVREVKRHGLPVVVVDDGSTDHTASIASAQGALVISHLRNQGKGAALRTGFEYALRSQYDGVVTLDGDGQHDPAEIPQLIRVGELQHAGMVVGDRLSNGHAMPAARRWANVVMSSMVSCVARQSTPDSQCGFRFIRKELLGDLALRATRFDIETELLLQAMAHRWKIVWVPIRCLYAGQTSHIRALPDAIRFLRLVLGHLMRR